MTFFAVAGAFVAGIIAKLIRCRSRQHRTYAKIRRMSVYDSGEVKKVYSKVRL